MNRKTIAFWPGQWCRIVVLFAASAGSVMAAAAPSMPAGFLGYSPYNGFVFEAVHLFPVRHDNFNVVEGTDYSIQMLDVRSEQEPSGSYELAKRWDAVRNRQVEQTAVPSRFAAEFKAMQSASNGDAAYEAGKDVPAAIRLYTAAAVDFRNARGPVIERSSGMVWPSPFSTA